MIIPSLEHDLILVEKALAWVDRQSTHTGPVTNRSINTSSCGEENTKNCVDPSCGLNSPTLTLSCPLANLSAGHSEHSTNTMPGLETPYRSSQGQLSFDIWQNWGSDLELSSPNVSFDGSVCPQQCTRFWSPPAMSLLDLKLDLRGSPPYIGGKADWEASPFLNLELGMPSKLLVTQTDMLPTSCDQDSIGNTRSISAAFVGGGHEGLISFSSSELTSLITNNSTYSAAVNVTHHDTSTGECSIKAEGHNMAGSYKSSSSVLSMSWPCVQPAYDAKLQCVKESSSERITEITYQEVSVYFGMPISQAAKKLKVGLTVLKKRCRALGIRRWPHRKMKSIDSLIHNVKDLANEQGTTTSPRVENVVKELEEQKRSMEEMPGVELAERTKKLRQACFKANYKKRRLSLMGGNMNSVRANSKEIGQCPNASASVPSYDPPPSNLLNLNPALVVPSPSSDHCIMNHFL